MVVAGNLRFSPGFKNVARSLLTAKKQIAETPLVKDATGDRAKYIRLPTVLATVEPILFACGWFVVQGCGENITDGLLLAISVETTLMHESGEWIQNSVIVPLVGAKKSKEERVKDGVATYAPDAQSGGGAQTYGRRYGLFAILSLAIAEDDDGASASLSRRRGVARLAAGAVQPTEWHDAGVMAIGEYAGTPMVQLKKDRLRRAMDVAKKGGRLDVATALSAELTRRATDPQWKEPEAEPEKPERGETRMTGDGGPGT